MRNMKKNHADVITTIARLITEKKIKSVEKITKKADVESMKKNVPAMKSITNITSITNTIIAVADAITIMSTAAVDAVASMSTGKN